MTFGQFRALNKHEQIEKLAHRREHLWREQHAEKVRQSVSKERAEEETKSRR